MLRNGMKWKKFSILAHFNAVFILSAFDQTHKIIKGKSSSQRSIQINRVGKSNGNYSQIIDISIWTFKQFATSTLGQF